jgi:hypothetical protein
VRIYPSTEGKVTLAKWFGAARFTYNKCVEALKTNTASATLH